MTAAIDPSPDQGGAKPDGGRRRRRQRPIGNLFAGTAINRIGDSVTLVALIWIVFEQTQSAGGVALVTFAYTILVPIGGLVVGGILDRFRVVPIMIGDAFLKATVVTLVLATEVAGVAVVPAALVAALYLGFTWMVGAAGMPTLIAGAIDPDGHPRANMYDALASGASAVIGPLIAGLLIETVSPLAALAVGALANVIYGVLLWEVRGDLLSHVPQAARGAAGLQGIARGYRLIFGNRLLLSLTLLFVSLNGISSLFAVALPIYATQTLFAGAAGYTILLSANAVGQMSGTIIGRYLAPRLGLGRAIVLGTAIGGLLFIPLGFVVTLPAAALILLLQGLVGNSYLPWVQVVRMRVIPAELRSRAFGTIRTMTNSVSPFAAIAAGALVPALGVSAVFVIVAVGWVLTAAALASVREVREIVA